VHVTGGDTRGVGQVLDESRDLFELPLQQGPRAFRS
jgi:hypothetical protein